MEIILDQAVAQMIIDASKRYNVSKNMVGAVIQMEYANQLPPENIRSINETKMDAITTIIRELEWFVLHGNGKPAGCYLSSNFEENQTDQYYCDYLLIFKEPIDYRENGHISNCLMACSSKRGVKYYHIGNEDKENKTGIYYLDTVCRCSQVNCSFSRVFDISGISSISEEKFQNILLSGALREPEEFYANVREMMPRVLDNIPGNKPVIENMVTPAKMGGDDLRYIG